MKIDLKILLIVLAVVLIVGLLEADPALRSRRSGGSSRRSSSTSSRRRGSSVSRRRRSSSGSSSGSGDDNTVVGIIVGVSVGIAVLVIVCIFCIYLCRTHWQSRQEITDSWWTHEMDKCRSPTGPEGFGNSPTKADEQLDDDIDAAQNPAFDNDGDNAALILPYPPGNSDQSAAYPQSSSSLPYPPQEDIDPPGEVTNAPPYPPQSTSSAYPPLGMREEISGVPPEGLEGETHEGSKAFAPPLQLDSGNDLPPPPSYEDIEEKKKM